MSAAIPTAAVPVTACRLCGRAALAACVDLGAQYLSSVFPSDLSYRARMAPLPLTLVRCDGGCGLVQLAHAFDLRFMYEAYPYASATNASMRRALEDVADAAKAVIPLAPGDVVLDIGCNDGTLLSAFADTNLRLVGVDPAANVVSSWDASAYTHIRDYFSASAFERAGTDSARCVFSIAMFYHLGDPVSFADQVRQVLRRDGVWIVQMAYLPAMLRTNMYDNIVHEHAGYYALHQMQVVLERAGLEVFDVTLNDVYGGSFRVFAKHRGAAAFPIRERVAALLEAERGEGLFAPETYAAFARRIAATRDDLIAVCDRARAEGRTVWAYGASTKGNTILQYCGLTGGRIAAAADASPFKIGKYMIGSDIPIVDEQTMRAARPDYLLALPYSFVDGFIAREAEAVAAGTRFIVPLPEVSIHPGRAA